MYFIHSFTCYSNKYLSSVYPGCVRHWAKPFTITITSKNKFLEKNLTKDVQDMYLEKNKIFLREIEKNLNKWKDILCSWIGKVNTVKMSILSKLLCTLSTTPIKISACFFIQIE